MDNNIFPLILAAVGFLAGVINTLAGGGSLLTLPVLIFMGLPPSVANGTNRIGIFIQSITSIAGFSSKGIKPTRFSLYLGISALIGSLIGAKIAINIDGKMFNRILALVMITVVLYLVLKPKVKLTERLERIQGRYKWVSLIAFFFIGIYGGFIQAGVGILILFSLSTINHINLVKSNAVKALVVFIYTIGALVVYIEDKQVNYMYGFILAAGNSTGGWIASRWSVQKGDGLVKVFLVVMVIAMAIKLWMDS